MKQIVKLYILTAILSISGTAFGQNFKVPKYDKFIMPNGLTVFLMEQHEVPLISAGVIVPAGAIFDGNKAGLASLTAKALQYGSKNYTKQQIEEQLDFIGSYVSTNATKEFSYIKSKCSSKDANKVLAILKDILLNPTFNKEEFEKEKVRNIKSLEQAKESPRRVINSYFERFMYGENDVYGNVTQGTPSSIKNITIDDCITFYKKNYKPNGSAVVLVGDFVSGNMKAELTKLFASWPKMAGGQINDASKSQKEFSESRVLLVNKDDAKETTFLIGGKGVNYSNPDFVAIDVINTLFGGRFTSMLNDELRVNSGLTYGANSRFSRLRNGGLFAISTFTATKTTKPAIDLALDVLNRLHKQGVSDTALASAKNYVKGQFPPNYETADQLTDLLSYMFWYNFNETFINNFEKNVDGLTVTKANEIIAKYFPKNNLQFVLIGKAADIKTIAQGYGKVTEVNIKDDIK